MLSLNEILALKEFESLFGDLRSPRLEQLTGDASPRKYYRISDDTKKSWVLQSSEAFEGIEENPFLTAQCLLKKVKARVPEILALYPKRGWIVMDDLGNQTLQSFLDNNNSNFIQKFYREAIDLSLLWVFGLKPDSQLLDDSDRMTPHFKWKFDLRKLNEEMEFSDRHLFRTLTRENNAMGKLSKYTKYNSKFLSKCSSFFCHRDFHSRNLMLKESMLYVIDFQDARMGPVSYDLVSLLWDPYVCLSKQDKTELLFYWKERLRNLSEEKTSNIAWDLLEEEIERMKIQRFLKVAGTFASFWNINGIKDYLQYLPPALQVVQDALLQLSRIGKSKESDRKLYEFLKEYDYIIKNTILEL